MEKQHNVWVYFSKIRQFSCFSAKWSMTFSRSMSKSRSIAKTHKSLNRLSDILLRVFVLINFILLNVRSHVVEETGMVSATRRIDITLGKACFNGNSSMYSSTMFSSCFSFSIGFSTCISLHKDAKSTSICVANGLIESVWRKLPEPGQRADMAFRIRILSSEKRYFSSDKIESRIG